MPKSNTLSVEDRKEMQRLHDAGVSLLQISHRFCVSPNTVRWHLGMVKRTTKVATR